MRVMMAMVEMRRHVLEKKIRRGRAYVNRRGAVATTHFLDTSDLNYR